MVVVAALLVAGGEAAVLLAAVDEPLHAVALPIGGAVEGPRAPLGLAAGDGDADAAPSQVGADGAAGVALVADQAAGPHPRPAAARAAHRAGGHEALEHG